MNDITASVQPTQQVFSSSADVIPLDRTSSPDRDEYVEAIQIWCKTRDTADVLSREEIGQMRAFDRVDVQRKAMIIGMAHYLRKHPRSDVAMGVYLVLTLMSDNERGCASVSQPTLARLFDRSVSSIADAQRRLKDDGLIIMGRGRYAGTYPVIPRVVTQQYNHLTWLLGALSEADKPVKLPAGPVDCQSSGQTGGLKSNIRPDAMIENFNHPVEDNSIIRPDPIQLHYRNSLKIGDAAKIAAAGVAVAMNALPAAASPPPIEQVHEAPAECWQTPQLQQMAALDVREMRAQKQVWMTASGMLHVAGDFKDELTKTFPLVDLTSGLAASSQNCKQNMHRGALYVMPGIIRQFGFMQQDAQRFEKRVAARQAPVQPRQKPDHMPQSVWDKILRDEAAARGSS